MAQLLNTLSNIFGDILNIIYQSTGNFGISLIIFAVIIKILQTPLEIKSRIIQAQTMKMSELQKDLREKYKNNQQKLNEELLKLYKEEGVNPLAGLGSLFLSIFNIFLIISMFTLVYSPLTYMKKLDKDKIEDYYNKAIEVRYEQENLESSDKSKEEVIEELKKKSGREKEINIIRYFKEENNEELDINMNFANLDLTVKPNETVNSIQDSFKAENIKVLFIPITYILISFINIQLLQKDLEKQREEAKKNTEPKKEEKVIENKNKAEDEKSKEDDEKLTQEDFEDVMLQSNKMMMYVMPIMMLSITMFTPLAIALYWLAVSVADIFKIRIVRKIADKKIKEKGLR